MDSINNTYSHILKVIILISSWYLTSISLHLYNKYLFDSKRGDFEFPLFTTMLHMIIQGTLSYLSLYSIFLQLAPKKFPSKFDYGFKVVPAAIATALDIGLSNSSLQVCRTVYMDVIYINLTFYTMVKSAAPVFVLFFAFLLGIEKVSYSLTFSILVICLGVGIVVAAEPKINLVGYAEVQAATVLSGFRWALTQVLLKTESIGMDNPLSTNLFLTPVVALALFFSFLANEGLWELLASPHFESAGEASLLILTICGGGFIAFLMVNIEFALIQTTNVITFSIAGIFKELITIWAATVFLKERRPTGNTGLGLIISLIGIAAYNYFRIYESRLKKDNESYEELDLSGFEIESVDFEDNTDDEFDEYELDNFLKNET